MDKIHKEINGGAGESEGLQSEKLVPNAVKGLPREKDKGQEKY